jgi:excisionase family DNA binding protein
MRLLTARQTSEVLQVKLPRVYELAREVLPAGVVVKIGRQVRFDESALNAWLASGGTLINDGRGESEGKNNAPFTA